MAGLAVLAYLGLDELVWLQLRNPASEHYKSMLYGYGQDCEAETLFWAVKGGHLSTVKLVLENGGIGDMNRDFAQTSAHMSPLWWAVENQDLETVQDIARV